MSDRPRGPAGSAVPRLDVEAAAAELDGSTALALTTAHEALQIDLAAWRAATAALTRRMSEAEAHAARELVVRVDRGPRVRLAAVTSLLAQLDTVLPGTAERITRASGLAARADAGLAAFSTGKAITVHDDAELRSELELIAGTLDCDVSVLIDDLHASAAALTTIYFVCAEALSNIAKHSLARRVVIEVGVVDTRVSVRVIDDGRGGADPEGTGLGGLARRITGAGGVFSVTSSTTSGTIVHAAVPR